MKILKIIIVLTVVMCVCCDSNNDHENIKFINYNTPNTYEAHIIKDYTKVINSKTVDEIKDWKDWRPNIELVKLELTDSSLLVDPQFKICFNRIYVFSRDINMISCL